MLHALLRIAADGPPRRAVVFSCRLPILDLAATILWASGDLGEMVYDRAEYLRLTGPTDAPSNRFVSASNATLFTDRVEPYGADLIVFLGFPLNANDCELIICGALDI